MPQPIQPSGWPRAAGYSNGVIAEGRMLFVAGQVGWNPLSCKFEHADFLGQARQALENVRAVLDAAAVGPEHLARMTWYLLDRDEYNASLAELGAIYREVIGRHFPAMSAVQVAGLVEKGARLEIECTAVLPPRG